MKATSAKKVVTTETITLTLDGEAFKILQMIAKKASVDTWTWSSPAAKIAKDFSNIVPEEEDMPF